MACERCADGILIADDAGSYIWANRAAADILGLSVNEIRRKRTGDLNIPGPSAPPNDAADAPVERGEVSVERPDGRVCVVSYAGARLSPGLRLSILRDVTERTQERDELQRVLGVLREAERVARIGFWDWDPQSGAVWWSNGMFDIHGRTPHEGPPPIGSWSERIHPLDVEQALQAFQGAQRGGRYQAEYRLRRYDNGELRRIRTVGELIPGHDNRPPRLVGAVRDVTEQRQTEEDLERVLDQTPDLIALSDLDGRLLSGNPAFQTFIGRAGQDMTGLELRSLTHPDDVEALEGAVAAGAKGRPGAVSRVRLLAASGEVHHADWTLVGVPEHGKIYYFGRDVTDLVRAEQRLRRSEKRHRDLLESLPCLAWETDARFRFTYVNQMCCQTLGYSREELIGRSALSLLPARQTRTLPGLSAPDAWADGSEVEVEVAKRDGTTGYFQIQITEVRNEAGANIGMRGVGLDVSERRRARQLEAQLLAAQRLESLAVLAGGVAHDFNNLLTAVAGFSSLAYEEAADVPAVREHLEEVLAGCDRARDLVSQILSFGRVESRMPEPTSLCDVVEQAAKLLRPTIPAPVRLTLDLDRDADTVLADPAKLHQVVMNLCANAVQAIGLRRGRIAVSVSSWEVVDSDNPQHLAPGSYVLLRVADDGPGIDPQVIRHVFDPFFTTKSPDEGSGLGLSVAHGIVTNAGGVLRVVSELDSGAEFSVYLPYFSGEESLKPQPLEAAGGSAATILVVDDDADILRVVTETLRKGGYSVTASTDPNRALSELAADPHRYDLLLVDYTMPRTDGMNLLRQYRDGGGAAPAILMSGYPERLASTDLSRLNIRGPLLKPFTLRTLAETVRAALAEPPKDRAQ